MGALRTSMATCGYQDIAEFNRAELMIAPALQTEGKLLQTSQGVGMGSRGAAVAAHERGGRRPTPPTELPTRRRHSRDRPGIVTAATAATELVDESAPVDVPRQRSTRSSSSTTAASTRS